MKNKVTVWIPTVDRVESFLVAFSSLLGQENDIEKILIGIDSDADAYDNLVYNETYQNLKFVFTFKGVTVEEFYTGGVGICSIKNIMLKKTHTEKFLYLEDDCWLPYNYVKKLNEVKGYDGVAGCQLLVPMKEKETSWTPPEYDTKKLPSKDNYFNSLVIKDNKVVYTSKGQVHYYGNNNKGIYDTQFFLNTYMMNTEKVRSIGGWNEELVPYWTLEEVWVSYKMYINGMKLGVLPNVYLWHLKSNKARGTDYIKRLEKGWEINQELFVKEFGSN